MPAIGFEDGGVEVVVKLLEDGDEALVVDDLVLGVQGFAGTDFLEDVVNAGEREVGMKFLLALAVRVEPLAKVADALLECAFFERGEWEGIETAGLLYLGSLPIPRRPPANSDQ
jgi:hypothetical protein